MTAELPPWLADVQPMTPDEFDAWDRMQSERSHESERAEARMLLKGVEHPRSER